MYEYVAFGGLPRVHVAFSQVLLFLQLVCNALYADRSVLSVRELREKQSCKIKVS